MQFRFFSKLSPKSDFEKQVRIRETILSQNDVRIIEILQKMPEQEPILFTYFENNANRAAVGFPFWTEKRNRETVLVKMGCKLLKSAKK